MNITEALQHAKIELDGVCDHSYLEAEIVLAFVLAKPRSFLHAWPDTTLSLERATQLAALLKRRRNKEPMAYITGVREFWSLPFHVTRDTLIPRPETEILVETVLAQFDVHPITLIDLGTGSGAIAIALASEKPDWQIYATDASEKALAVARQNSEQFALKNITFCSGHWFAALPSLQADVVVSNPPYIAEREWETYAEGLLYEPLSALVSGSDGLDAIREISSFAKDYLKPGGYLMVEHGFSQGEAVRSIFAADGYNGVRTIRDSASLDRVTIGQY